MRMCLRPATLWITRVLDCIVDCYCVKLYSFNKVTSFLLKRGNDQAEVPV